MSTAYFIRRSSLFVSLRLSNGKKTDWTHCFDGGLMETSDSLTIKELRAMDKAKKCGVREISKEEYEEFKKKPAQKRAGQHWQPLTTPSLEPSPKNQPTVVESVVVDSGSAAPVPQTQSKPSVESGIFEP